MGASPGRPRLPTECEYAFWTALREGRIVEEAAATVGVSPKQGRRWFGQRGGVMPPVQAGRRTHALSFAEREDIALLHAAGNGVRAIARHLDRDAGTISRELRRVPPGPNNRHAPSYRASTAQAHADAKARRPKPAKLATHPHLHAEVQSRLTHNHSPEQIARRLRSDYPDQEEMRVSHETIYQAIYVQGRGSLRRELARCLRTGGVVKVDGVLTPSASTRRRKVWVRLGPEDYQRALDAHRSDTPVRVLGRFQRHDNRQELHADHFGPQ